MGQQLSNIKEKNYDIAIVGYGMLGNIAALLLAHYDLSVIVIEKKQQSDLLLAKSARLDAEAWGVLEQIGLSNKITSLLNPLDGTQVIDKKERVLLEFNQGGKSKRGELLGFYQPDVQKILQQEATNHPNITIRTAHEVETFEQDEDGVDVYIAPTGKQDFEQLRADYLLVCNGQYSRIADFLEVTIEDFNYKSGVLCVDTINKTGQVPKCRYAQTIYDTEFPVVRITNNERYQRWEFQIGTLEIEKEKTAEIVKQLLSDFGNTDLEILSAFVYNFEARMLSEWQYKRILIAGDAAHVMPPYLGMGLTAGIKDIANLAWKLYLLKYTQIHSDVLLTYTQERQDNVRHLIQLNLWVKRLFKSSKLRWIKGFVPVIPKWFLKRNLTTENHLKVGLVDNKKGNGRSIGSLNIVNKKGKKVSLNQQLSRSFCLMTLDENPVDVLSPTAIEYLAHLQTQFIQLTPQKARFLNNGRYAEQVYDKNGEAEAWLRQNKAQYVLIRPDRMVYGFYNKKLVLNQAIELLAEQLPLAQEALLV